MLQKLEAIRRQAEVELAQAENTGLVNDLRIKYLGKKGELTAVLRGMGGLSGRRTADHRPGGQRSQGGYRSHS